MKRATGEFIAVTAGNTCGEHHKMLTKATFYAAIAAILSLAVAGWQGIAEAYASADRVTGIERALDTQAKRFDRIEEKIDRLLQRGSP